MPVFKFDTAVLLTATIEADTEELARERMVDLMREEAKPSELFREGIDITNVTSWDDPRHLVSVPENGDPAGVHDLQKMRTSGDTALEKFTQPAPKI